MADIVHWLHKFADLVEAGHAQQHVVMHMRAGADEIERLRAGGCARDQGTTQYCAEAAKKDAEIASLLNTLADARTESMKLRAALEPLACTCDRVGNAECSSGEVDCPFWQARAALDGQPAPSGWRPIETAPKDGSRMLLAYRNSLGKWRRGIAFYAPKVAIEGDEYGSDWCE